MDHYDYQQAGTNTSAPKYAKPNQPPLPSREELLARDSFQGSVNSNRYLDKMLGKK